jgi:hypothetical protein
MDPEMMQSMASLGIMQKISTGYMALDVALCCLFPLLLRYVQTHWREVWTWLSTWKGGNVLFTRHITYQKREGYYCYEPQEANNSTLQEAVLLYVGSQADLVATLSVCPTH